MPPVVDASSIPEQLLPGDTFRLRGTTVGGAKVRVTVNDRVVGAAVAGPNGNWRTTIGFASAGTYTLTTQLMEGDAVLAASEPVFVTVLEPIPTPEPTVAAAVDASQGVSETVAVSDTVTATVDASQGVSDTVAVSDTVTAAVDASQGVSDTVASDPAAPDALPGTGGDFSQGVPWVVMLLLIGALLVLGLGRLSNKPTA